jgi:hypothetical protein
MPPLTGKSPMADFDLLICNGTTIYGTGNPMYRGDISVRDGEIAAIGHQEELTAAQKIDVQMNHPAASCEVSLQRNSSILSKQASRN